MGTSCMTLVARHGKGEMLAWLLHSGLLPEDAPNGKRLSVSALAVAIVNDHVDCLRALLTKRANVESGIPELSMSPLALAAQFAHEATMNILLG